MACHLCPDTSHLTSSRYLLRQAPGYMPPALSFLVPHQLRRHFGVLRYQSRGGCSIEPAMCDLGRTFGVFLLSVMFVIPVTALDGQAQPNQKPLAFEVASIKPNASSDIRQRGIQPLQPGGLFRSVGLTLREYVRVAYGKSGTLLLEQVAGGPSWVDSERFDITAKVQDFRSPADPNQYVLTMLRALLVDRFKLTLHTEQPQRAAYDLIVSAPDRQLGPRLRRTTEPCVQIMATQTPADVGRMCGVRRIGPRFVSSAGTPMSWLAIILSQGPEIKRVVRDRAGL